MDILGSDNNALVKDGNFLHWNYQPIPEYPYMPQPITGDVVLQSAVLQISLQNDSELPDYVEYTASNGTRGTAFSTSASNVYFIRNYDNPNVLDVTAAVTASASYSKNDLDHRTVDITRTATGMSLDLSKIARIDHAGISRAEVYRGRGYKGDECHAGGGYEIVSGYQDVVAINGRFATRTRFLDLDCDYDAWYQPVKYLNRPYWYNYAGGSTSTVTGDEVNLDLFNFRFNNYAKYQNDEEHWATSIYPSRSLQYRTCTAYWYTTAHAPRHIILSTDGNGYAGANPITGLAGSTSTLSTTAKLGYEFDKYEVSGASLNGNILTFNEANPTAIARFKQTYYGIEW